MPNRPGCPPGAPAARMVRASAPSAVLASSVDASRPSHQPDFFGGLARLSTKAGWQTKMKHDVFGLSRIGPSDVSLMVENEASIEDFCGAVACGRLHCRRILASDEPFARGGILT